MASKLPRYMGDAKFAAFLTEYGSPVPFHVVRLRMLGAIASPTEIEPVLIVSSLWPQGTEPKLTTKDEAEAFFTPFVALWHRMARYKKAGPVPLTKFSKLIDGDAVRTCLITRVEEIESGFCEGFWAGQDELQTNPQTASAIDAISAQAVFFNGLLGRFDAGETDLEEVKADIARETARTEELIGVLTRG